MGNNLAPFSPTAQFSGTLSVMDLQLFLYCHRNCVVVNKFSLFQAPKCSADVLSLPMASARQQRLSDRHDHWQPIMTLSLRPIPFAQVEGREVGDAASGANYVWSWKSSVGH